MKDTITDDLMVDTLLTQVEQQLKDSGRECELLKEQLVVLQRQIVENNRLMHKLGRQVAKGKVAF